VSREGWEGNHGSNEVLAAKLGDGMSLREARREEFREERK